jgi:prevent-host-death family protein
MKQIALSEAKDQLSKYLHDAEKQDIVILRHGKPAGVLIGFASEDDWFDYRVENDERFLARIEQARRSVQEGRGVPLEELHPGRGRANKRLQPTRAGTTASATRRRARS